MLALNIRRNAVSTIPSGSNHRTPSVKKERTGAGVNWAKAETNGIPFDFRLREFNRWWLDRRNGDRL
jgi:hypothetical protein